MSRRPVVALIALIVSLGAAAPAGAATLTGGAELVFTAAAGIPNEFSVGPTVVASTLEIETGNDRVPHAGLPANCSDTDGQPNQSPASEITCTGVTSLRANLGDLADTGTTTGTTDLVTLNGEAGDDTLTGAGGGQLFLGGPGRDNLDGAAGIDVLDGGADGDVLSDDADGRDAIDTLRGAAGPDLISVHLGATGDVYDGGEGVDTVVVQDPTVPADPPRVFVDLAEGVLGGTNDSDTVTGIEDVALGLTFGAYAINEVANPATIVGNSGANSILTGSGKDSVNPAGGNDLVNTGSGDDGMDLRDGFADRALCGPGADSVLADTLDAVADDCETVTRTDVGNANATTSVPEDRPPTVAFTAPASSAKLSTTAPNVIEATATDDRGITQVIFSTGERTICTDTTAPYTCEYVPSSADVGRDTLVAVAVDSAQQTASAVRVVSVPRFRATSLTAATTPKRDSKAPYTFTTKGRLALPGGVLRAAGCKGTVDVSFKAGKKTVSSRRVALKSDCSYSSKVTFRLPSRLNPKTLNVVVVFSGNDVLEATNAKNQSVRPR